MEIKLKIFEQRAVNPWVVPPPCNSRKGFTFWFNRGLLLTLFWDCYRLGAVPNI